MSVQDVAAWIIVLWAGWQIGAFVGGFVLGFLSGAHRVHSERITRTARIRLTCLIDGCGRTFDDTRDLLQHVRKGHRP